MRGLVLGPVLFVLAIIGGLVSVAVWGAPWAAYLLGLSGLAMAVALWIYPAETESDEEVPASSQDFQEIAPAPETALQVEEGHFMILQNHDDAQLDALLPHIEKDQRTLDVTSDEGRYYSVPDGEDLAEWFTLHVSCLLEDEAALMRDIEVLAGKLFGIENALQFRRI